MGNLCNVSKNTEDVDQRGTRPRTQQELPQTNYNLEISNNDSRLKVNDQAQVITSTTGKAILDNSIKNLNKNNILTITEKSLYDNSRILVGDRLLSNSCTTYNLAQQKDKVEDTSLLCALNDNIQSKVEYDNLIRLNTVTLPILPKIEINSDKNNILTITEQSLCDNSRILVGDRLLSNSCTTYNLAQQKDKVDIRSNSTDTHNNSQWSIPQKIFCALVAGSAVAIGGYKLYKSLYESSADELCL